AMEQRMGYMAGSLEMLEAGLKEFLKSRNTIHTGTSESQLLELWLKGEAVDWRKLYTGEKPSRIHLPAYPFARERYWADSMRAKRQRGWLQKQWTSAELKSASRKECAIVILA